MGKIAVVFGGHSPIAVEISRLLSTYRKVIHYSRTPDVKLKKEFEGISDLETWLLPTLADGTVDIYEVERQISVLSPANLIFVARNREAEEDYFSGYKFEILLPHKLLRSCASIDGNSNLESAVLFCSPAGQKVVSDQGAIYHAHKAAIEQIIRFYAVKGRGFRVNGVSPGGYVLKDRNMNFYNSNHELTKRIKSFIPSGDFVNTIEIAHLVNFLISEKSRQINGQIITIDGGYSAIEPSHLLH